MLESVQGTLLERDDDFAVVDVGGVRLRLDIPASSAAQLPERGKQAELFTRLSFNANDGSFALFGFATPIERECYDILVGISGIGPRKALMILSQIEIGAFAAAIVGNDLAYLSKIKGVGRKTAERLLVELREKAALLAGGAPSKGAAPAPARQGAVGDAVEALMALGCRPAVAERAVATAVELLGADAAVDQLVREALKHRS